MPSLKRVEKDRAVNRLVQRLHGDRIRELRGWGSRARSADPRGRYGVAYRTRWGRHPSLKCPERLRVGVSALSLARICDRVTSGVGLAGGLWRTPVGGGDTGR